MSIVHSTRVDIQVGFRMLSHQYLIFLWFCIYLLATWRVCCKSRPSKLHCNAKYSMSKNTFPTIYNQSRSPLYGATLVGCLMYCSTPKATKCMSCICVFSPFKKNFVKMNIVTLTFKNEYCQQIPPTLSWRIWKTNQIAPHTLHSFALSSLKVHAHRGPCALFCILPSLGPLHSRDWEPMTITLQALSIEEKGGAGPSSLHTMLEGPTEYVNARWM